MATGFDYELKDDMKLKITSLSLSNSSNYRTDFMLEGIQISMFCMYNTRIKKRSISFFDRFGNTLLPQTFVGFGKRCELCFTAEEYGLSYYLTLKPKNLIKNNWTNYDYLNWANDFDIAFVGYDRGILSRLEKNIRVMYVGN